MWRRIIDLAQRLCKRCCLLELKSGFHLGVEQNHPVTRLVYPCEENQFQAEHAQLLLDSYRRLTGKALLRETVDTVQAAQQLFQAPFAVLSHDTQADPVFNYANLTALALFGFSWNEFTTLPSRMSAEPVDRTERKKLLQAVAAKGFVENYRGIRITKQGVRFQILDAVVWNLYDAGGVYRGQAACIEQWRILS